MFFDYEKLNFLSLSKPISNRNRGVQICKPLLIINWIPMHLIDNGWNKFEKSICEIRTLISVAIM
jgi:hypothetical protein